ncbi:MAG: carbohydrate ABC transporter permease [Chloroflexota bacterium]
MLLVGVGIFYPLIYVTYISLQEYSPFYTQGQMSFIGLQHYQRLLGDGEFWRSLVTSGIWVLGSVIPQFLIGLGIALLLNERFPGRGVIRSIILLPWVVSGVVTGILWMWLFDGTVGVINDLLVRGGLAEAPVPWAVRPDSAFFMLFVANAWRGAPFFAIMLLAALQSISPDIYEAARVDGAGRWDRFRRVTLPMIMNAVILSTLLRCIWTFNYIDLIWTMTHGGPANNTRTLAMLILDTSYRDGDFGYAAALSVGLVLVLLSFSGLYWRLNRFGYQP